MRLLPDDCTTASTTTAVAGRGAARPGADRSPSPTRFRQRRRATASHPLTTFLLALPMLFVFGCFAWWPLVRAGILSVQETNLVEAAQWTGLDNFRRVLDDPLLWTAVKNTAWFAFLALVFGYPLPIILAVLVGELRRGRGLYAGLAYLPVVIPPVASILLWRVFYDASPRGTFNTILGWIGLGPYPWFQSTTWAMPSIVLLATWSSAGATVIIYLAALTAVNTELYEAAEVDGASLWRKVWHVTLPQLRTVLFVTLILQLIGTFQLFTEPYLLTQGGPANATMTVVLLLFRYAFGAGGGGDYGAAAALSLMLAAVLAVFTAVYFRLTKSWSTK
ncbi:carbohydrate ABC transporter permease [Desertimonas flava]|uniref:carbohydrate ABC transporter permease n=1 Tax=Desertimonas flava TaxID=2064846 RepID=UPI000E34C701|nr:sugar ABC transporter permease [Desertimonas flava]